MAECGRRLTATRGLRPQLPPTLSAPLRCHDDAAIWAAIMVGFVFLLRASEYCAASGGVPDFNKVLRGVDVSLQREGSACGQGVPSVVVLK